MSSPYPHTTLTTLPFEIRDQIFRSYFTVDGGYVFNGDSEKLSMADGNPIDFSLMYTCRLIADDTKGMPLSVNTIHFSTVHRSDWNGVAGCFNYVSTFYRLLERDMVSRLARFLTPDMYSHLALKFPSFMPQLRIALRQYEYMVNIAGPDQNIREGDWEGCAFKWAGGRLYPYSDDWYDGLGHLCKHEDCRYRGLGSEDVQGSVSTLGPAMSYCLRLLAEKEPAEFAKLVYQAFPRWVDTHPAHEFFDLSFHPWAIPSAAEVARVASLLDADNAWQLIESWYYRPNFSYPSSIRDKISGKATGPRCREKIRFSAAAIAIRFLEQLPIKQRLQIQKISLYENLPTVGTPAAHAQGFAPFFKENQKLRIERRVSVLRCIAESHRSLKHQDSLDGPPDVAWFLQEPGSRLFLSRNQLNLRLFNLSLADWLFETHAASDVGIPVESFTLVLEGGPYVDFCSDLFQQGVRRDIAWQKAYDACINRGFLRCKRRVRYNFVDQGFEEAIEHLTEETSFYRSDFNTGCPLDFEAMVEEQKGHRINPSWAEAYDKLPSSMVFPPALDYEKIMVDHYEIQTEDEYS
ncbi:hypothetical protein NM208_g4830 [Fusarium decemcellulare]|uniref:Uncharacterized protein n=1 Tax=Fusarium decemcellulare TaxID=57161 RepID=A0ACC1SJE3_9HYPO|nr:hypothetical protein NM208_g4830 [Fusarium decemcellulare]